MSEQDKVIAQAYCDGVNDFFDGVNLFGEDPTARLLPPEFIVFGITKENWRPWYPGDIISIAKLLSF